MEATSSLWYLENIDVTGIFCPQKIGRGEMDRHIHKVYKKGEYIFLPEELADKIFFLTEGSVKIGSYSDSGKEITKAILGKGEVFGESSLIGEEKRRDFAIALEETTICAVTLEEMKSLMRDHSALSLFLLRIMGSRMLEMEQRLESLVFKDSRSRVVEFLVQLGQRKGKRVGFETLVPRFMTHQEIANLTATSRQTVTTILNELRNKNILTFNRRRLLIRDIEQLAKEASSTD
ncbi:MAG: Crp/Fnr family transcriptional regulator [Haliscomenobacter sp.]|nr:Crp/Fnr family transcriptional regulator [Haliscomenobacter sp.]MBK8655075.1 Crp/Fnr family transcriptional regulator [Haliscomenobacter sp.]MBP9075482.1 Crp/Fnr family transcriptional regulator [Haliscomenobacter sp.]MBP9874033.1 Crp/Fnr family transcriptional regulator [Haliscomenobacter sp.]